MESSNAFLKLLIKRYIDIPVLVVALTLPTWLDEHAGPILFMGAEFPPRRILSKEFRFYEVMTSSAIAPLAAREDSRSERLKYDLIFLDHDHKLESLVEQINAVSALASSKAVFIFDDAIPPTVGMAGPKPTQPWWVGEVWMVPHVLRSVDESFFSVSSNLLPTGLLAASGFELVSSGEIQSIYEELKEVDTDEQLAARITLGDFETMLSKVNSQLQMAVGSRMINIGIGTAADSSLYTRIAVNESFSYTKSAPSFITDLSSHGHDLSSLTRTACTAPGKYIDTFSETYVLGFDSLIANGKYFSHWEFTAISKIKQIASGYGSYENQNTSIRMLGEDCVIPISRLADATHIDQSVMFGTPDEPDNYGMWLLLALPSLNEFLLNRSRYDKFMINIQHEWQRKLLECAGLDFDDLVHHDRTKAYLCSKISIIRKSFRNLFVNEDETSYFQDFASRIAVGSKIARSNKIFVSRLTRTRKMGSYRGLINEDELISGLQMLGFEIVEPEFLPFSEQVSIFRAADFVVGLGGAALFNTIFCKPRAKVVTIESGLGFVGSHTNIFDCMGLQYGVILGEEDRTDS